MSERCTRCGLFHWPGTPCLGLILPDDAQQPALVEGALLAGRYRVVRPIHRGGMSAVYLAEDRVQQGEQVVLKALCVPLGATDAERREAEAWFGREAYLLGSLQSPLIPRFNGVFREGGRSYIAQEYVAGENLDQVVARDGPLPEALVAACGVALCDLLRYLHERDEPVIYRDLKPANLLWRDGATSGPHGYPLAVVDFGIARPYREGEVGTVIGTPGYAPPEQYQGLATPQSDVYALGATLHRLLTGYEPEQGAPFTFPPVRQLNPAVSPEMAAVIERAVRLEPAARFATALAMGAALGRLAGADLIGVAAQDVQSTAIPRRWLLSAMAALLAGPMLLSLPALFLFPLAPGPTSYQPARIVLVRDQPRLPGGAGGLIGPAGRLAHRSGDHGPGAGGGQLSSQQGQDGVQP